MCLYNPSKPSIEYIVKKTHTYSVFGIKHNVLEHTVYNKNNRINNCMNWLGMCIVQCNVFIQCLSEKGYIG